MRWKSGILPKFLTWSSRMAGKPITFLIALSIVIFWLLGGFIFGVSDTWLLIINTAATINAALMVFIIQNTQNRDTKALHLKLDELIRASKEAQNELIAIEELEEEEFEEIKKKIRSIENSEGRVSPFLPISRENPKKKGMVQKRHFFGNTTRPATQRKNKFSS